MTAAWQSNPTTTIQTFVVGATKVRERSDPRLGRESQTVMNGSVNP
jgi:hypothetical protein